MYTDGVREAYHRRAAEYAAHLGEVDRLSVLDRHTIETWAEGVTGPLLDLGCGPGQWTAHLAARGHAVTGWDPVPAFVEWTRDRGVPARLGDVGDLATASPSWGGILAWYSLIHLDPAAMPAALAALHRALLPEGRLLLGFFDLPSAAESPEENPAVPFEHAVAPAHLWPRDTVAAMLRRAGFQVEQVEHRTDPGSRPHATIHARRAGPTGCPPDGSQETAACIGQGSVSLDPSDGQAPRGRRPCPPGLPIR